MIDPERENLLKRIERLENALMFYATSDIAVISFDNGQRACEALYGKEEEDQNDEG